MAHPATPDPCPVASDLDRQGDRRNRHRMRLSQHLALNQTLPQTIRHDTRDLPGTTSRCRRSANHPGNRIHRPRTASYGNSIAKSKTPPTLRKPASPVPPGRRVSLRSISTNYSFGRIPIRIKSLSLRGIRPRVRKPHSGAVRTSPAPLPASTVPGPPQRIRHGIFQSHYRPLRLGRHGPRGRPSGHVRNPAILLPVRLRAHTQIQGHPASGDPLRKPLRYRW